MNVDDIVLNSDKVKALQIFHKALSKLRILTNEKNLQFDQIIIKKNQIRKIFKNIGHDINLNEIELYGKAGKLLNQYYQQQSFGKIKSLKKHTSSKQETLMKNELGKMCFLFFCFYIFCFVSKQ